MRNNLNFVMPSFGNYLGKVSHFTRQMISDTAWERAGLNYSIFMLHTKWDFKEVSKTLQDQGDVAYISIVRDPVELFISMWDYKLGHRNKSLEDFAMNLGSRKPRTMPGLNSMLRDFGMTDIDLLDKAKVLAKIKDIEKTFHLILVAERFKESLILMKNELCWSHEDVVSFKLNSKARDKKSQISDLARAHLKDALWPDYLLYNHFYGVFQEKVEEVGKEVMGEEVSALDEVTMQEWDACIAGQISSKEVARKERVYGQDMIQYKIKDGADPTCKYYTMKENLFIDSLRDIQRQRAGEALRSRV